MNPPAFLALSSDRSIAYHRSAAKGDATTRPGVVFLGGFNSDMTGAKATWLEGWARARGIAYLRFDYRGHGASSGAFENGCVGDWADDAAEAIERLTDGPQILVGSSMGGWIALIVARRMPDRVAGFLGVAAAPDFTEDVRARLTEPERGTMTRDGRLAVPSRYSEEPLVYTRRLLEDGERHLILASPYRAHFPVRLLHGTADPDVSPSSGVRLLDHLQGDDIRLTLVKGADHRFSGPRELALIGTTLHDLLDISGRRSGRR